MTKKNWVIMVATLVARNAKEAMVTPGVGSGGVCVGGSLESCGRVLCWCVWQESGFSRCENVFTFNLLYKDILQMYFQTNLKK
jgi:hypothetical protein